MFFLFDGMEIRRNFTSCEVIIIIWTHPVFLQPKCNILPYLKILN